MIKVCYSEQWLLTRELLEESCECVLLWRRGYPYAAQGMYKQTTKHSYRSRPNDKQIDRVGGYYWLANKSCIKHLPKNNSRSCSNAHGVVLMWYAFCNLIATYQFNAHVSHAIQYTTTIVIPPCNSTHTAPVHITVSLCYTMWSHVRYTPVFAGLYISQLIVHIYYINPKLCRRDFHRDVYNKPISCVINKLLQTHEKGEQIIQIKT
jgi:hypothetical protein